MFFEVLINTLPPHSKVKYTNTLRTPTCYMSFLDIFFIVLLSIINNKGAGKFYDIVLKEKNCQQTILNLTKLSLKNERDIKILRETKALEPITTRPSLQEILKGIFQVETK